MTWPPSIPKPEAVREYESIEGYTLGYPGEQFPAVAIDKQDADDMLAACAEVIERLQAMSVCKHLSATGVDTQPDGPEKVWRCDGCGFTYRNVPDGNGGFGWYVRVPVWDAEDGGA